MKTVAEWMKRLEDCFTHEGVVGGRSLPQIQQQEHNCGLAFIRTLAGHRVLADSFVDFFATTLKAIVLQCAKSGWPQHPMYGMCFAEFLAQFRGIRSAEILSLSGYPFEAFSLQRNLKDRAIFLGAIVNGTSSLVALYGIDNVQGGEKLTEAGYNRVLDKRKKEEARIFMHMIFGSSGLGGDHIDELKKWNSLFNVELHGSRLSIAREVLNRQRGVRAVEIGPAMDADGSYSSMYLNRFAEIAWMVLRTLPFLQTEELRFSCKWAEKWSVLDDSFRQTVESLGDLGKKIAPAFVAMVDAKFGSSPEVRYTEPGGSVEATSNGGGHRS